MESTILANQMRCEKTKDQNKKNIGYNHRNNYTEYNKSSIFNTINSNESNSLDIAKPKALNRYKTLSNFEPKYNYTSASDRKFNEIYKDKVGPKKDINNTLIGFRKAEKEENNEKPTLKMTAAERKLKALYPEKSLAEIEKIKKITSSLETISEVKHMRTKSTKAIRMESMYSNIFHDPNKHKIKEVIYNTNENKVKPAEEKKNPVKVMNKTKTAATFDWKNSNSELLFKGERNQNENTNAKTKKMNQLKSIFDKEYISNKEVNNHILTTDLNDKFESEISEKIKEKFTDNNKLSRTFHNMSTLHEKDFYKKTLSNTHQDKTITNFEIENINYDSFNLNEFKKMYNSNGIHLYDVNLQGNYGNGNEKGSLAFKIRKNEDIEGFNEKLKEINQKIVKDFKIELKVKNKSTKKPLTENMIPATVKWNNTKIDSYAQHRNLDKNGQNESKITLDVSERYASNKTPYDNSYKNTMSKKTFEKNLKK